MKKKVILLTLALLMTTSLMLPCLSAQTRPQDFRGNLTVWSFSDELNKMINSHVKRTYRNLNFNYTQSEITEFTANLDRALASGSGVPDIIALEAAVVRKYVESGQLLDLTDIYEANKNKLLAYPVEVGTHNGRVYALSWQATPGAMFYRRSLARQYLGTDDPAMVQAYFSNISKFMETAALLKERSGRKCVVVPGYYDLFHPFLALRSNPWVVNGQLVIDPAMEQLMDISKTLNDNGLQGGAGQWSEDWFAGMKGELNREWLGGRAEVFAYFLPTWGLHYVLKTNAGNTSGDWAMVQGPVPYQWGGTWLAAWKDTPNPQLAREFIRFVTTDDDFLQRYARDTGDVVSNIVVQERIRGNYRERFLGNQNHYMLLSEISRNINGRLLQANDLYINERFIQALNDYLYAGKTKQQALADFRRDVTTQLRIR
jgi:ABC-type glycerol-3-phosphate transport system substrate-binding protein